MAISTVCIAVLSILCNVLVVASRIDRRVLSIAGAILGGISGFAGAVASSGCKPINWWKVGAATPVGAGAGAAIGAFAPVVLFTAGVDAFITPRWPTSVFKSHRAWQETLLARLLVSPQPHPIFKLMRAALSVQGSRARLAGRWESAPLWPEAPLGYPRVY